ncbi:rod-binding protein [Pseudothermotoga sp.]|nr:hypothetical protein [Pseudothermotoga sp.]MCX7812387.1 hypothetical protein [Pseudothermotoga sp.]MDW8140159.1 hypothetical protein [Pseudothermotoga sp.]
MVQNTSLISTSSINRNSDKLWNACADFTATIFYDVFRKMYESIPKSNLFKRTLGEQWFTNMVLFEYSRQATRNELASLTDMIYRTLAKKVYGEGRKAST